MSNARIAVLLWPSVALIVLGGVAGASLGSFAAAVVSRSRRNGRVSKLRSRCLSCGSAVAWHDNIPVLSWLGLRGRCRACGAKISLALLITEIAGGVAGIVVAALLLH